MNAISASPFAPPEKLPGPVVEQPRPSPAGEMAVGPLVELARLLSEAPRLRVLCELSGGERNVTQLCHALGLPQPTVSHHLAVLRGGGLLSRRRDGKMLFYALGPRTRATEGGLEIDAGSSRFLINCR